MTAHLQEAAIVEAAPAEDRLHRRLHVVVDVASAGPLEQSKGPVAGVEHYLLRLARIGPHEQHPAVAKAAALPARSASSSSVHRPSFRRG